MLYTVYCIHGKNWTVMNLGSRGRLSIPSTHVRNSFYLTLFTWPLPCLFLPWFLLLTVIVDIPCGGGRSSWLISLGAKQKHSLATIADDHIAGRETFLPFSCFLFYQSSMSRKVAAGSKATNPPPSPRPLCGHCQQPAQPSKRLLVCSSCHEACYCSPEHQVADWVLSQGPVQAEKEREEREEGDGEGDREERERCRCSYQLPVVDKSPDSSAPNSC